MCLSDAGPSLFIAHAYVCVSLSLTRTEFLEHLDKWTDENRHNNSVGVSINTLFHHTKTDISSRDVHCIQYHLITLAR